MGDVVKWFVEGWGCVEGKGDCDGTGRGAKRCRP